eukprot:TRINITY_DN997_c0_g1_i2.p1 TRINITY_DN997_c0_g1~~TRINITY_DN997_c0_g1_i2.p1  ORF type:complete len:826 (-),score=95.77 TRINITY_DN997_c0_g1_i2:707-3184(-)
MVMNRSHPMPSPMLTPELAPVSTVGTSNDRHSSTKQGPLSLDAIHCIGFGISGSLQYRGLLIDVNEKRPVSPWNDIELYGPQGHLACVCKTPAGSWVRYEVTSNEPWNPIRIMRDSSGRRGVKANGIGAGMGSGKQAGGKRIQLAHYADNAPWNTGVLTQTWGATHDGTAPLEVVEIGAEKIRRTGEVYYVKPLGAFSVEEGRGALTWKILAIACDDPMAPILWDWTDLETQLPGLLELIRDWLKTCLCVQSGDKESILRLHRPASLPRTLAKITEFHESWVYFQSRRKTTTALPHLPPSLPITAQLLEATWQEYTATTEPLPLSILPLSCPVLDSTLLFDASWLVEDSGRETGLPSPPPLPARKRREKKSPTKVGTRTSSFVDNRNPDVVRQNSYAFSLPDSTVTDSEAGDASPAGASAGAPVKSLSFSKAKKAIFSMLHLSPTSLPFSPPSPPSTSSPTALSPSPTSPPRTTRRPVSRFFSFNSRSDDECSTATPSPVSGPAGRRSHEITRRPPTDNSPRAVPKHRPSKSSDFAGFQITADELFAAAAPKKERRGGRSSSSAMIAATTSEAEVKEARKPRNAGTSSSRLLRSLSGRRSEGEGSSSSGTYTLTGGSDMQETGGRMLATKSSSDLVSPSKRTESKGISPSLTGTGGSARKPRTSHLSGLPVAAGTPAPVVAVRSNSMGTNMVAATSSFATANALGAAGGGPQGAPGGQGTAQLTAMRVAQKEEEKTAQRRRSRRRAQSMELPTAVTNGPFAFEAGMMRKDIMGGAARGRNASGGSDEEEEERWGGGEGGLKRSLVLRRSLSFQEIRSLGFDSFFD